MQTRMRSFQSPSRLPQTSSTPIVLSILILISLCAVGWYLRFRHPVFPLTPGTEVIVFESSKDSGSQIYVMNVDGSNPTRLTHLTVRSGWLPAFLQPFGNLVVNKQPQLSSDGKSIVFQSDVNGSYAFYSMHADGSGLRQLTSPLSDNINAVLSPNGQWIAYTTNDGMLQMISSDGAIEKCLTCDRAGDTSDIA